MEKTVSSIAHPTLVEVLLLRPKGILSFADAITLTRLIRVSRRCRDFITSRECEPIWEAITRQLLLTTLQLRAITGSRDLVRRVLSLQCLHGTFSFTADEAGQRDNTVVTRVLLILTPLGHFTHARLMVRPRGTPVIQGRALIAYNGIARYDTRKGHLVINFLPSLTVPKRNMMVVQETRWVLSICKKPWLYQNIEEFRSHAGGIRMMIVPGESKLSNMLEACALSKSISL